MDREKLFASSLEMIYELKQEIINSNIIDCGPRLELVEQCIYISFEHGIAVNHLLTADLPIQALVLLRAQFEAVVRSYWLLFIAPNQAITKLNFGYTFEEQFQSDNYPMVSDMLEKLSKADLLAKPVIDHLCDFKKIHIKQLNSFVHTGKQSFTRNTIGFSHDFLIVLMRQSNNLITVAAQIMLAHSVPDNQKFINYLTGKYRQCFYLDEDVDLKTKARVEKYFSDGYLK